MMWSGIKTTNEVERCSNSGQIGNILIETAVAYPVLVSPFNKVYIKVQVTQQQAVRQGN